MVDELGLQTIPEERVLVAASQIQEMISTEEMQEAWQHISPKAMQFLKYRAMTVSDAHARHLMGHKRKDGLTTLPCGCGERLEGWTDLREATVGAWKKSQYFRTLYTALMRQPVMHAATRLQGLAPAAVHQLEGFLHPDSTAKDNIKLRSAIVVLEGTGLKATEGVNVRHNAVVNAGMVEDLQLRMARDRYVRGMPISSVQRALLQAAGVEIREELPVGTQVVIPPGQTERTLDGEDVQVIWGDGGDENEEYLPN